MQRIPEPEELMDEAEQAQAYADADFSAANKLFVELLEQLPSGMLHGRLLDLGCGPADIPLLLAARHPELSIDAVDGAQAMLKLAKQRLVENTEAGRRVRLLCEYLPSPRLAHQHYQLVVSNSLLHHLVDPGVLWDTVKNCAQPGAQILIMDLARPTSELALDALVETYAIDAPDVLRRDFRNSLMAAYTVGEIHDQLHTADLDYLDVSMVSDRHLAISGTLP